LVAANELDLQELVIDIQSFLIENKANWIMQNFQNFNLVYQTSVENDSFLELRNFCAEIMSNEMLDLTSISEKSLMSLIQNNNLRMKEVQIWEYVLKWGLAQNPGLPSDPKNFLKYDFNVLKNIIQQYVHFINFYKFTSKEFLDFVFPFKKILPKELREDLLRYFLGKEIKEVNEIKEIKLAKTDTNIEEPIRETRSNFSAKEHERFGIKDEHSPYNAFMKSKLPKVKAKIPNITTLLNLSPNSGNQRFVIFTLNLF
jgi:hypothetical protein